MFEIGEIRTAGELGYSGSTKRIRHACLDCGEERWVVLKGGASARKRCRVCAKTGERSPQWKGGSTKTLDGYIRVRLYPDDFFYPMTDKAGYVPEHRLIVAKTLNRCLLPWETIHHKEGFAKDDNRYPETLELLPSRSKHDALTRMINYIRKLEREIEILKRNAQWYM